MNNDQEGKKKLDLVGNLRYFLKLHFFLTFYCSVAQLYLTLPPHGLQHARLPCPSPSSRDFQPWESHLMFSEIEFLCFFFFFLT